MKRVPAIILLLLLPAIGVSAINPFKPYKPLKEIDYALNWSLGYDSTSIAYKPDSFTGRSLLPMGLLATSILYNDNYLDKRIVKIGGISQPALKSADYLQFSPLAIMYGMKAAGLQGRSDWPRMLTADMGSFAIMNLIARPTKHILKRERPDGRAFNSYPSGHTATAFMTAHMLQKEYGETVSPWIGVGGYGIAATTGIFRVIANRHWCSDVLGGAAIGIFSTELAYELTDILFGEQGLKKAIVAPDIDDIPRWKFGLYSDYSMGSDVFTGAGYGNPNAKPACSIGIDASWMPWYIGPTVRAGLTQMKWTGENVVYLEHMGSVADVYTFGAGVDIDIPVIERITVNGQAIAGYSPCANSYSFFADREKNQTVEWSIPAGMHCYGNLGMTVRTSTFSSVSMHAGLDFYDKVWRSFVVGARFNYTF
jgi:membrane-associated phospholipid phosphatase